MKRLYRVMFLAVSCLLLMGWPMMGSAAWHGDGSLMDLQAPVVPEAHSERPLGSAEEIWDLFAGTPKSSEVVTTSEVKLMASDRVGGQTFGTSVSISGYYALIGAPDDDESGFNSGAAYIWHWNGTSWQQVAKLLASDGAAGDKFGTSVSLLGDVALVGAAFDDGESENSGSAYFFRRRFDDGEWIEEAKVSASDGGPNALFGSSLSLSGDRALIGAPYHPFDSDPSSASAYVFRFSASPDGNQWHEQQKLSGHDGNAFGAAVSMSDDMAVVGAPGHSLYSASDGAAYLFRRDGDLWSHLATVNGEPGESLGSSVSLFGSMALIGAPASENDSGSAYFLNWDGAQWNKEAQLTAPDGGLGDQFGRSVSLLGEMALVGAENPLSHSKGAAYLFAWDGQQWNQDATFLATDSDSGDEFGASLSLSANQVLIGAPFDDDPIVGANSGAAYLYDLSPANGPDIGLSATSIGRVVLEGSTITEALTISNRGSESLIWSLSGGTLLDVTPTTGEILPDEQSELTIGFDASTLALGRYTDTLTIGSNDPDEPTIEVPLLFRVVNPMNEVKLGVGDGTQDDNFARSVSVSGNSAIVGDDLLKSAYIYGWNGSQWQQEALLQGENHFGVQVSLSESGSVAIVNAPSYTKYVASFAYIYRKSGNQWQQEAVLPSGHSVSISDNLAIVGYVGRRAGSGSATVYRFDGQTWQQDATLASGLPYSCGASVSIDDNVAIIGCPSQYGPGRVYLFRRHREGWQEEALLTSSSAVRDYFGSQVEIDGDVALVNGASGSNSVWVYRFDGTSWHHEAELWPSEDADHFASSFSTNGEYILVGARAAYDLESEAVPAYLYRFDGERWQEVRQITASDGADGADDQKFGVSVSLSDERALIGAPPSSHDLPTTGSAYLYDLPTSNDPNILVSQSKIYKKNQIDGIITETIMIENSGFDLLSWSTENTSKLQASPSSGTIPAGGSQSLTITIDMSNLALGSYTDTLTISSNDPDEALLDIEFLLRVMKPTTEIKLSTPNPIQNSYFGDPVSLSGQKALIGAPDSSPGAAHILVQDGNSWQEQSILRPSDSATDNGFARALWLEGDVALVGAPGDNNQQGAAYIFRFNGSDWIEEQKLLASDELAVHQFGFSVALSGNVALVAAVGTDAGDQRDSAYLFRFNGSEWVEEAILQGGHGFGRALSLSGDLALVGAPYSGAAYLYRFNGSTWQEEAVLQADNSKFSDFFGTSVVISDDLALVGAIADSLEGGSSGWVTVFRLNGTEWERSANLTPHDPSYRKQFGGSLSLSEKAANGRRVAIIGALGENSAYLFGFNGSQWLEEAKLEPPHDSAEDDHFGRSVSVSGEMALVGASGIDDEIAGLNVGSAYLYNLSPGNEPDITRPANRKKVVAQGHRITDTLTISNSGREALDWSIASNVPWLTVTPATGTVAANSQQSLTIDALNLTAGTYNSQLTIHSNDPDEPAETVLLSLVVQPPEKKLLPDDGKSADRFGSSVSIHGDLALIGRPADDELGYSSGSAIVYRRHGDNWQEEAKVTAPDGAEGDTFGAAVSIDGHLALIGAPGDDDNGDQSGSAYFYRWNGQSWIFEQKIGSNDGAEYDDFGRSVSLFGEWAVIAAPDDDDNGDYSGAAYLYRYDGSRWQQEQKIVASDGASGDRFAASLSLYDDMLLVGAPSKDDKGLLSSGAAYVYRFDGSHWIEEARLRASDASEYDHFGTSVSLAGDMALIGAPDSNGLGFDSGSAYLFRFTERSSNGSAWIEEAKLSASDGREGEKFGTSVSLSESLALVGAYNYSEPNRTRPGAAYVFTLDGTSWQEHVKVIASSGTRNDAFGTSLSLTDQTALIGAPGDNQLGEHSGSAYLYDLASILQDIHVYAGINRDGIYITWQVNAARLADLDHYELYRRSDSSQETLILSTTLQAYTDNDPNLIEGVEYCYHVQAKDGSNTMIGESNVACMRYGTHLLYLPLVLK